MTISRDDKFNMIKSATEKMLKEAEKNGPPTTGRFDPNNRTRLSWWFPQIPQGINVPQTQIIPYDGPNLLRLVDGDVFLEFHELCASIRLAGKQLGWPLFLRTDYLSGKHSWMDTCHVTCPYVPDHVVRLVTESEMADMMGFPTDRWIARKLIPTVPAFHAFWGDMPIVKERRYFVHDATVMCHHPYWPPEAFKDHQVSVNDWRKCLDDMNHESADEVDLLSELSSQVGAAIGGNWSIDWLWSEPEGKWYLTDMAEAAQSYHWPGCKYAQDA